MGLTRCRPSPLTCGFTGPGKSCRRRCWHEPRTCEWHELGAGTRKIQPAKLDGGILGSGPSDRSCVPFPEAGERWQCLMRSDRRYGLRSGITFLFPRLYGFPWSRQWDRHRPAPRTDLQQAAFRRRHRHRSWRRLDDTDRQLLARGHLHLLRFPGLSGWRTRQHPLGCHAPYHAGSVRSLEHHRAGHQRSRGRPLFLLRPRNDRNGDPHEGLRPGAPFPAGSTGTDGSHRFYMVTARLAGLGCRSPAPRSRAEESRPSTIGRTAGGRPAACPQPPRASTFPGFRSTWRQ